MKDTILVVDDEPFIRELLEEFLKYHGFKTCEAGNGSEALKIIAEDSSIGLVISDVFMPGITGFDLCSQSKNLFPNLPFILVSGNSLLLESAKTKYGADVIFEKPCNYAELLQAVKATLNSM